MTIVIPRRYRPVKLAFLDDAGCGWKIIFSVDTKLYLAAVYSPGYQAIRNQSAIVQTFTRVEPFAVDLLRDLTRKFKQGE
jgi:hypothetical protein